MGSLKILFLQDHIRHTHVINQNGQPKVDYKRTDGGKMLTKYLADIGVSARQYQVDYDYDLIPEPAQIDQKTGQVKKYKTPVLKERVEPELRLKGRLLETRPDIIIPMGGMGTKYLLNNASITQTRGVPQRVELTEDYSPWVLPMLSMEYLMMNPNQENLTLADIATLKKFLDNGDKAFIARKVEYEFVETIERVRQIFSFLYNHKPLTAWDLETNSLRPEMKGSKPLVASLSWCEGQGVTIPLEHKDFVWSEEDLAEVYFLLERFIADPDQVKVGHNI